MTIFIYDKKTTNFENNYKRIYYEDATAGTFIRINDMTNFDYFSDSAVVGDTIYFYWAPNQHAPSGLQFYVGTPLVANDIQIVWEYAFVPAWDNDDGYIWDVREWRPFQNITDTTNNFQNAGVGEVYWGELPTDFSAGRYNGEFGMWVRARIVSVDNLTEGGANSTNALMNYYPQIEVTDAYQTGSVTGGGGYNAYWFEDNTKNWTTNELVGRYVYFYDGECKGEMYPIRYNTNNRIYLGIPSDISSKLDLYTQKTLNIGDNYIISYVMKDLYDAVVSAGKDWMIKPVFPYAQTHWGYRGWDIYTSIYLKGASGLTKTVFFSTMREYLHFNIVRPLITYGSNMGYTIFATGVSPQSENNGKLNSENIGMYGSVIDFENLSYFNPANFEVCGWVKGAIIRNSMAMAWVKYFKQYDGKVIDTKLENMQYSINSGNSESIDVTLARRGEPLRNPHPDSKIKGYQTDNGLIYAVGNHNMRVEYGKEVSRRTFLSWKFPSPAICEMVNMKEGTNWDINNYAFYWYTNSGNDYGGVVHRKYTFDLKVLDEENNPVENAKVILKDVFGNEVFNVITDSDGNITTQETLTHEYTWDDSGSPTDYYNTKETNHNPFDLTIKANGYKTYKMKFVIDKKTSLVLSLTKQKNLNMSNIVQFNEV